MSTKSNKPQNSQSTRLESISRQLNPSQSPERSEMKQVVLYDNPSCFGTGTCWSPNVWKIRMMLNFKGIDYRTEWVHGPDIAPMFSSFGIPPHKPGTQMVDYTVPTVQMPDGSYIMESKAIAKALEPLFPEPSVRLDSPVLAKVEDAYIAALRPLVPVIVPRMPRECLSGPSVAYHREARKLTFNMTLEELEASKGGEQAWEKAKPGLLRLAEILKSDANGPFCLGETPFYGDFIIAGFLEWCICVRGDIFQRLVDIDPVFLEFYNACEPWLKRNDH